MAEMIWFTLPFAGERLTSVVHSGNGKDSALELKFANGRRVLLPVNTVRVEADRGVVVDTSSWDDMTLLIEYRGPDLSLHSGRFGRSGGNDEFSARFLAGFIADAQSWLATGCDKEFSWTADVELRLASRPPVSSDGA